MRRLSSRVFGAAVGFRGQAVPSVAQSRRQPPARGTPFSSNHTLNSARFSARFLRRRERRRGLGRGRGRRARRHTAGQRRGSRKGAPFVAATTTTSARTTVALYHQPPPLYTNPPTLPHKITTRSIFGDHTPASSIRRPFFARDRAAPLLHRRRLPRARAPVRK